MVGMVILGETEPLRGEATCLDSSSSQVARPGFELKPADSKRHVQKIWVQEGEKRRETRPGWRLPQ